jgi:toxin CcdB
VPQFAVYRNENSRTKLAFPFLVDVQPDLFTDLQTRVVIPLTKAVALTKFPLTYLTPTLTFEGEPYLLMTPQLAGIARADLGAHAGSVAEQWRAILAAVDFLMSGF